VSLNRYRLQLIFDQFLRQKGRPEYGDALPWMGVLLAFLLALIPSDFQDLFGVSAEAWEGATLFGVVVTGAVIVWKLNNAFVHRNDPVDTPESVVEHILGHDMSGLAREFTPAMPSNPERRA